MALWTPTPKGMFFTYIIFSINIADLFHLKAEEFWMLKETIFGYFPPSFPQTNIFSKGSDCYSCGSQIQDGADGEGTTRYHCIDCARSDQCEDCWHLKQSLLKKIDTKSLIKYAEVDPHLHHCLVAEPNIPIFLRFPIVESQTLYLSLHNAFKYKPRKSIYLNKTEYIAIDLVLELVLFPMGPMNG